MDLDNEKNVFDNLWLGNFPNKFKETAKNQSNRTNTDGDCLEDSAKIRCIL